MQHTVSTMKRSKMFERRIKKLVGSCVLWTVLLAALVQASGLVSAFAEGETAAARETRTLTERFYACDRYNTWNYEFSDDYFFLPSDTYHHPFAQVSAGLAFSAARAGDHEDQGRCLVTFLRDLGFEEIDAHTYDTDPTADSVTLGIGHKQAGDVTVIALAVCGGNYRAEWANNMKVGDGVLSEGFAESAQIVVDELDAYLEKHPAEGDRKLWITGYSRGGGVVNIAAAKCTDSGRFQDVYAYTFACPLTTRQPGDYRNIFNILRKNDPIPKIPLVDWGYQRHGVDMLIVSPETDPNSEEILERTAALYREMSGSEKVRTILRISGDREILMKRFGSQRLMMDTVMEFQKGKRYEGVYETPYGSVDLEILTNDIDIKNPEKISIDYSLLLKGLMESRNQLDIEVIN